MRIRRPSTGTASPGVSCDHRQHLFRPILRHVEVFQYIQSDVLVWDGVVTVLGKKLFDDARFEQCFLLTAQRVRSRFGLLEFSKQEA